MWKKYFVFKTFVFFFANKLRRLFGSCVKVWNKTKKNETFFPCLKIVNGVWISLFFFKVKVQSPFFYEVGFLTKQPLWVSVRKTLSCESTTLFFSSTTKDIVLFGAMKESWENNSAFFFDVILQGTQKKKWKLSKMT